MSFFSNEEIELLSATTVRVGMLVKMEFVSETVHIWNGNTDLASGGQVWKPMHGAGGIDGVSITGDATAEPVTFTLTGLPGQEIDILAQALAETPDVTQQLVTIFVQLFDSDWQPIGVPIGFWWGFMQPPRVTRSRMDGTEGAIQSIAVTAENAFFNRSRPPHGRYTDRDQQKRYPGDRFFQFTPSLLFKSFRYPDF